MSNKFLDWVSDDNINNTQPYSDFEKDSQRLQGFKSGTPASSIRVNTALRQANLVACALMDILVPDNQTLDFRSSRKAVADYMFDGLRNIIGISIDIDGILKYNTTKQATVSIGGEEVHGEDYSELDMTSSYNFVVGQNFRYNGDVATVTYISDNVYEITVKNNGAIYNSQNSTIVVDVIESMIIPQKKLLWSGDEKQTEGTSLNIDVKKQLQNTDVIEIQGAFTGNSTTIMDPIYFTITTKVKSKASISSVAANSLSIFGFYTEMSNTNLVIGPAKTYKWIESTTADIKNIGLNITKIYQIIG